MYEYQRNDWKESSSSTVLNRQRHLSPITCDLVVKVASAAVVYAHSEVLSACNEILAAAVRKASPNEPSAGTHSVLAISMLEGTKAHCTPGPYYKECLDGIVDFAYIGRLRFRDECAEDIGEFAKLFGFEDLAAFCGQRKQHEKDEEGHLALRLEFDLDKENKS